MVQAVSEESFIFSVLIASNNDLVWQDFDGEDENIVEISYVDDISNPKVLTIRFQNPDDYSGYFSEGSRVKMIAKDSGAIQFFGVVAEPPVVAYEDQNYANYGLILTIICRDVLYALNRNQYQVDSGVIPDIEGGVDLAELYERFTQLDDPPVVDDVEIVDEASLEYRDGYVLPSGRVYTPLQALQTALKSGNIVRDEDDNLSQPVFDLKAVPNIEDRDDTTNLQASLIVHKRGEIPNTVAENYVVKFSDRNDDLDHYNSVVSLINTGKRVTPRDILTKLRIAFLENGYLQSDVNEFELVRLKVRKARQAAIDATDLTLPYTPANFEANWYSYMTKADIQSGNIIDDLNRPLAEGLYAFRDRPTFIYNDDIPARGSRNILVTPSGSDYRWEHFLNPDANRRISVPENFQNYNGYWYNISLGSENERLMRFMTKNSTGDNAEVILIGLLSSQNDSDDEESLWGLVKVVNGRDVLAAEGTPPRLEHVDEHGNIFGSWIGIGDYDSGQRPASAGNVGITIYDPNSPFFFDNVVLWHSRLDTDYNIAAIPAGNPMRSVWRSNGVGASTTNPLNDYSLEITEFLSDDSPNSATKFYPVIGSEAGDIQKLTINSFVKNRLPEEGNLTNKVERKLETQLFPTRKIRTRSSMVLEGEDIKHTVTDKDAGQLINLKTAGIYKGMAATITNLDKDFLVYIKTVDYTSNTFTTKKPADLALELLGGAP